MPVIDSNCNQVKNSQQNAHILIFTFHSVNSNCNQVKNKITLYGINKALISSADLNLDKDKFVLFNLA